MGLRAPKSTAPDGANNLDVHRLHAGLLGKVFGIPPTAQSNIAGAAVVLGIVIGGVISGGMLLANRENPFEIWKYTLPTITGALGFIFGRK